MLERMKEIETENKITRRNSLFIPKDEFDELRDIAQLHPSFAKGGKLKKMASMRVAIHNVLDDDKDSVYDDSEGLEQIREAK